jgi:hypothetical protein
MEVVKPKDLIDSVKETELIDFAKLFDFKEFPTLESNLRARLRLSLNSRDLGVE